MAGASYRPAPKLFILDDCLQSVSVCLFVCFPMDLIKLEMWMGCFKQSYSAEFSFRCSFIVRCVFKLTKKKPQTTTDKIGNRTERKF